MIIKKYTIIILSVFFICFLGYTYLNVKHFKTSFEAQKSVWEMKKNELEDEATNAKIKLDLVMNINNTQILSEDKDISHLSICSESGSPIPLRTLIIRNNNPKLIFRYSEKNCDVCIDSVLVCLKKYSGSIGVENIILLASYEDITDLKLFRKFNKIGFEIFNALNIDELPIERLNTPYLFILDNTLRANCIFIPEKTIQKRTDSYFQVILKRYFYKI
jgi:hypothetical protein